MLKQINMNNFKKFTAYTVNFKNGLNQFTATNEYGKTTIADAVAFVLFGKLNNGSSDLAKVKPTHNLKAKVSVELVFVLDNNRELTLKREYGEEWKRERENVKEVLQGHFTYLYVNGIKQKTVRDYETAVLEAFNCSSMTLLQTIVNPYHFGSNLTAKERLTIIKPIIEVSHDEIMKAHPEYKDLETFFINANYNDDVVAKDIMQKHKAKQIEVGNLGSAVEALAPTKFIAEEVKTLNETKRNQYQADILNLKLKKDGMNNPTITALKTELLGVQAKHTKSVQDDSSYLINFNKKIYDEISKLETEKNRSVFNQSQLESKITNANKDILANQRIIDTSNSRLQETAIEFKTISAEKYDETIKCECCGQALPVETWKRTQSSRLLTINQERISLKKTIEDLTAEIEYKKEIIKGLNAEVEKEQKAQNDLLKDISIKRNSLLNHYQSDSTKALSKRIEEINTNINNELANSHDDVDYQAQIDELNQQIIECQAVIDEYGTLNANRIKAVEKNKELTKATDELAKLEVMKFLIQDYRKAKLETMAERASNFFPTMHFQFIEDNLKEDSYNEVCNLLVEADNGTLVQFNQSNTATQIKNGIKFSSMLAKAINAIQPCIIVDNAEAITDDNRHFETKTQIICFVAKDRTEETTSIPEEELKQESLFDEVEENARTI